MTPKLIRPLQIIRYADQPDSPWANGLGSTRLLWADEAGERRISIARLEGPAAFSSLPGTARALAVLDPIHLTLRISGRELRLRQHDTVHFSGDEPTELLHLNHPGRVLNLMARAERWAPHISTETAPPPFAWVIRQNLHHQQAELQSGDLLFSPTPIPQAFAVDFRPTPSKALPFAD